MYNVSFHQKLESNACLAITGAIRSTSKEKLYQELGLESLQLRRWYWELGMSYKIFKSKSPQYFFKLIIPGKTSSYIARNTDNILFFPSLIIEWNNLDPNLRNSENVCIFQNNILTFIRPKPVFLTAILRGLDWSHDSD